MSSAVIPPPSYGRAIAYGNFRRLDRSAKRGAERPSLHNQRLIVDRRSLHSGLRPSVETTGKPYAIALRFGGGGPLLSDEGAGGEGRSRGVSRFQIMMFSTPFVRPSPSLPSPV